MNIPKDPFILMSYLNTQLRDNYSSLDELCAALCINKSELESKLAPLNVSYNDELNKFA